MSSDSALLIHPYVKENPHAVAKAAIKPRDADTAMEELCGLAEAISLTIAATEIVPLRAITPATYIGKGKVEELAALIKEQAIPLAIIDAALSPVQQRNLEKALHCKVIDRTALILEIFGARAHTREGVLQVELAALEYQKSRLVRSWTHLERQRGGAGFMGGPGETQIEVDRRIIGDKITRIKQELKEVAKTRALHRTSRRKVPYPIVALVGYTNAGKSTLFNRLTGAEVLAEDMLFATLDPTMRVLKLPSGRKVILSDTVGFISNLPTQLVAAFRATLEEVIEANLILHVRDAASPDTDIQRADVHHVLKELGVNPETQHNIVEVLNKVDRLTEVLSAECKDLRISALTGLGIEKLVTQIDQFFAQDYVEKNIRIHCAEGKKIAWLRSHAEILTEHTEEEEMVLTVLMLPKNAGQWEKMQIAH